jgi:hypothetical protein
MEAMASQEYLQIVFSGQVSGVFPVEPVRLNERISIQRGVFVTPGTLESFVDNLLCFLSDEIFDDIVKLVLPRSAREDGLSELQSVNVNRATLFPGLDGLAQSLQYLLATRRHFDPYWRTIEQNASIATRIAETDTRNVEWSSLSLTAFGETSEGIVRLAFIKAGFEVDHAPAFQTIRLRGEIPVW